MKERHGTKKYTLEIFHFIWSIEYWRLDRTSTKHVKLFCSFFFITFSTIRNRVCTLQVLSTREIDLKLKVRKKNPFHLAFKIFNYDTKKKSKNRFAPRYTCASERKNIFFLISFSISFRCFSSNYLREFYLSF